MVEGRTQGQIRLLVLQHININLNEKWPWWFNFIFSERTGVAAEQLGCSVGRPLLSTANGSGGQRGLEMLLEDFFPPSAAAYLERGRCKQLLSKTAMMGKEKKRGGLTVSSAMFQDHGNIKLLAITLFCMRTFIWGKRLLSLIHCFTWQQNGVFCCSYVTEFQI